MLMDARRARGSELLHKPLKPMAHIMHGISAYHLKAQPYSMQTSGILRTGIRRLRELLRSILVGQK